MAAVGFTSTGIVVVGTVRDSDSTYAFRHINAPVVCERVVRSSSFIWTFMVDSADTLGIPHHDHQISLRLNIPH
jgi:hypothetical protein